MSGNKSKQFGFIREGEGSEGGRTYLTRRPKELMGRSSACARSRLYRTSKLSSPRAMMRSYLIFSSRAWHLFLVWGGRSGVFLVYV